MQTGLLIDRDQAPLPIPEALLLVSEEKEAQLEANRLTDFQSHIGGRVASTQSAAKASAVPSTEPGMSFRPEAIGRPV